MVYAVVVAFAAREADAPEVATVIAALLAEAIVPPEIVTNSSLVADPRSATVTVLAGPATPFPASFVPAPEAMPSAVYTYKYVFVAACAETAERPPRVNAAAATLPTDLTVKSSDTAVATVAIAGNNTVTVTGVKAGTAVITVTDPATSAAATAGAAAGLTLAGRTPGITPRRTILAGLAGSVGGAAIGNVVNEVIAMANRPKLPDLHDYQERYSAIPVDPNQQNIG
jgi:hypothetical protein